MPPPVPPSRKGVVALLTHFTAALCAVCAVSRSTLSVDASTPVSMKQLESIPHLPVSFTRGALSFRIRS